MPPKKPTPKPVPVKGKGYADSPKKRALDAIRKQDSIDPITRKAIRDRKYDTGGNDWYGFDGTSGQPKDKSKQGD